MARQLHGAEVGFSIDAIDGDAIAHQLAGSAVPGGDTSYQDAAPVGSTYQRSNGEFYVKVAATNAASDWSLVPLIGGDSVQLTDDGVTTVTTIDSILVDSFAAIEWEIYLRDTANPDQVRIFKFFATHDGTATADAASVDSTRYGKLRINASFNRTVALTLTGTGATQAINLTLASTETSGVDIRARRNVINF